MGGLCLSGYGHSTKLGQQMLRITCLKVIAPHLRFEDVSRTKSRSTLRSKVPFTTLHSLRVGGIAASLKITRAMPEYSFEDEISFASRQDQLRVEREARVEDVISFVLRVERQTRGDHEARVQLVESAISSYCPYPTKWVARKC